MKISLIDASEYFRGLLLLSRKDDKITEPEAELVKRTGKVLGFEKEFCDAAVREILENEYILDTPPEFSTVELAMKFVKDGLALAFSNRGLPAFETVWLRETVEKNGVDMNWFEHRLKIARNGKPGNGRLEADDLSVQYY